jgi:hypothetical protein
MFCLSGKSPPKAELIPLMQVGRSWTFLYYLNGDNDLREQVSLQLAQLAQCELPQDVAVIAQLTRGEERWSLKNLGAKLHSLSQSPLPSAFKTDWRGTKRFVIQGGASQELSLPESAKVSDPKALEKFLVESMQQCPADHYALVVASHGDSQRGILRDGEGNWMPLEKFQEAIDSAQSQTHRRINLMILQACQMGQPTITSALASCADHILAYPGQLRATSVSQARILSEMQEREPDQVARHALHHLPGFTSTALPEQTKESG